MKKLYILLSVITANMFANGDKPSKINLISSENGKTIIEFIVGSGGTPKTVLTPNGMAQVIDFDKGSKILKAGAPDLQKLTTSIIIPDKGEVEITYTCNNHIDIPNVLVAPSKGNLYRNVNPDVVPYFYGPEYSEDAFFPKNIESISKPYIVRDYRGVNINICPIQYNPVTKTLRIHTSVLATITTNDKVTGVNEINRMSPELLIDKEFESIYARKFINYVKTNTTRYSSISENGSMLIITHDAFATDMLPFVTWKNKKGIETEMVLKSVAGSTSTAIKAYIAAYYTAHPNLKYVLLVGDAPQIPSSTTSAGDSDNNYGYLNGNDSYPELFIGRFSATTSAHVQTMVNRTIRYEQFPQANAAWYKKGIAIASDQGPGDDNEMDFEHQRNLRAQMLAYTYTTVSENYDGSQGIVDGTGNPTAASIGSQINDGVGIITYTGHGSSSAFSSSGYSSANISSLTNTTMHPFIWSVACVNGDFVGNASCFAETWLRAGTPTQPTGALATLMSTINQSWDPPMEGQDEMVNIMVESATNNIKRTFGGISMNGCMQMNDIYSSAGDEMTDTWTCFGDPSVMLYTNAPIPMITSHVPSVPLGTVSITVNCNVNDALICLSRNGVILGTGVATSGSAIITIPAATSGVIDVVATAYNKIPYSGIINVGASGIDENVAHLLSIYPNPATATVTIASQAVSGKAKIVLYNELGQVIMPIVEQEISGNFAKTIDVSQLKSGIYFIKMELENTVLVRRIIIQK